MQRLPLPLPAFFPWEGALLTPETTEQRKGAGGHRRGRHVPVSWVQPVTNPHSSTTPWRAAFSNREATQTKCPRVCSSLCRADGREGGVEAFYSTKFGDTTNSIPWRISCTSKCQHRQATVNEVPTKQSLRLFHPAVGVCLQKTSAS